MSDIFSYIIVALLLAATFTAGFATNEKETRLACLANKGEVVLSGSTNYCVVKEKEIIVMPEKDQ